MVAIADDIHERICDDHGSRLSQLEREAAELREKLEQSFYLISDTVVRTVAV